MAWLLSQGSPTADVLNWCFHSCVGLEKNVPRDRNYDWFPGTPSDNVLVLGDTVFDANKRSWNKKV
jgi:hypothetical protein